MWNSEFRILNVKLPPQLTAYIILGILYISCTNQHASNEKISIADSISSSQTMSLDTFNQTTETKNILVYTQYDTLRVVDSIFPDETDQDIDEPYEATFTRISFSDSFYHPHSRMIEDYTSLKAILPIEKDSLTAIVSAFNVYDYTFISGESINSDSITSNHVWVMQSDTVIWHGQGTHYPSCEYDDISVSAIIEKGGRLMMATADPYNGITLIDVATPSNSYYYVDMDYDPTDYVP